jgi:molecular chaperone DnaJ
VILHVRPHDIFHREEGTDILCEVPVPMHIAALGGDVDVPTPEGFARLRIEPGTESGRMFRLRGKGVPSVDGYGHGDLHVRVVVEVPSHLSSKQKKALKDFSDTCADDNYPATQKLRARGEEFFKAKEVLKQAKTET